MKDQQQSLDNLFHITSRFIIVLPIVIIIFGIILKLSSGSSQQKSFLEYNLTPTPIKSQNFLDSLNVLKKSSASARFNLTGPLSCPFSTETAAVNAYIKDKKIFIQMGEKNVVNNYLLNGDCVYIWKSGFYSGEKICGISQQVGIVESLLSSGFLDPNLIFSGLGQVFNLPNIGGSQDVLKSALSSCKNEEIPNSVQFEIPRNVLFKNKILK